MDRTTFRIAVTAAFVSLAGAAVSAPHGLPEQVIPKMLGVNIHLAGPGHDDEIAQIADAGFRFVRMDFTWAEVEKAKGEYSFSAYDGLMKSLDSKGIRPYFIFDYGNKLYDDGVAPHTPEGRAAFAAFAGAAAAHFKDRGVLWEIWNEPNMGFWKPTPNAEDYTALAKAASAAIKAADPEATILAPAISASDLAFMENCFRYGLLGYADVVSVHPYRGSSPETVGSSYARLRSLIARYAPQGKRIPIVSGEWGYSTTNVSELQQAQYLVRMFLSNMLYDVPLSIWYDWRDDCTDPKNPEHNFGTVYRDLKPKPAYTAAQTLSGELNGLKLVRRLASKNDEYVLLFKGPQGYKLTAWTTGGEREIGIPTDAVTAAVVSMDGRREALTPEAGSLKLRISQSPLYVDVGPSEMLALEEAVDLSAGLQTKWRPQDKVTAVIANPFSRELKGTVTLTVPSGKQPMRKRFSVGARKTTSLTFSPDVLWDGRSNLVANAAVEFSGIAHPVTRTVDLGISHRISARLACPMNRVVEFRIASPAGHRTQGKLKLFDVKGLKLRETSARFEVENQTVVALALTEPTPKEFSLSYRLVDFSGKEILRTPVLHYSIIEDFSSVAKGERPADYSIVLGGDEKVAGKAAAFGAIKDTPYAAIPAIPACQLTYDVGEGHRCFYLAASKSLPMTEKPIELGLWIYGDGKGNIARCRYVDSTGQTFQPEGFAIDWQGWRYKTFPLDGSEAAFSGGASDGKVHPPLRLETPFLLDNGGKRSYGALWLGPMMLVSEPVEKGK